MNSRLYYCILWIGISGACSPPNTKISSYPKKIGVKGDDFILIMPMTQVKENENEQLMNWANDQLKSKLPWVKTIRYWDAKYKSNQHGFVLPSFHNYDTANFQQLREGLGVNFILLSTLNSLKENYTNELNNPNYQRREAQVSLQLLDLNNRSVVWHCATRVFANPIKANGATQEYSINILSGNFAVNKAYKESINRLIKSIADNK